MRELLEVKNLEVSFGEEKVLKPLSFNLKEKENLVIIGPNGSGKTVLLKALLGFLPHQGEVKWANNVKIAYVPQRFSFDKNVPLSVKEFFSFKNVSQEKVLQSLEEVGLNGHEIINKSIGTVSSGQAQRILIAWSLCDSPDVLIFDEPTSGVDVGGEETIYRLLGKIEEEKDLTMILVTHETNIVYKFANRVLCLSRETICHGTPQDVFNDEMVKKLYGDKVKFYEHSHD